MLNNENKQNANQQAPTDASAGDSSNTSNNPLPSISLPKGGGAIRGIDEKFAANPVTGTGSMTVSIATSPGRSGFGPQLSLSYDSGAGNGPFGFGWSLSRPSITRKTDKGLPRYYDAEESDVFILSGSEDLVPLLDEEDDEWRRKRSYRTLDDGMTYTIHYYRPRIEGLFARIERWTNQRTGEIHWRSITKDNITTLYGKRKDSRISDPEDLSHIFSWLICESYDDKGNVITYEYKAEDSANVDLSQAQERNRTELTRSANRYVKRIRYGNRTPHQPGEDFSQRTGICFEVVFDYGEHNLEAPTLRENVPWPARPDAFSDYRAGFEVRTYRLCRRVLMFHHFPEDSVGRDCLVRSTDFAYHEGPVATFIHSLTQSGYSRQTDNTYRKKPLPQLEFTYSQVHIDETIRTVDSESVENLPYGLDGSHYQWVDLDGEGIAGILTEQGRAWFYKRNNGNARFLPAQRLLTQPSLANLSGGRQQLLDFTGDGRISLAQFSSPESGFYERTTEDSWEPFRSFASLPSINWADPNIRFIDVTGDGLTDVLITDQNVFTWYPSLRRWGFGPGERTYSSLNEEHGPELVFADADHLIYLADMSGDGLSDLVRIRNGEVCYWPNIGYGRFGAKVNMDNAPWFDFPDLFDQKRIRLADIDGSGTTDIIYLGHEEVKLFFNQSGNQLNEPHVLSEFPRIDSLSSVSVVDLLGKGTACIVWSSPLPSDVGRPMRYIDLMGGEKPHLLLSVNNNMGAETKMQYAASTKFYLADRARGTPWITHLPFPVYVVERVETCDWVSNNQFVTRYAYHHGYYDGYEREFRGFGMVEQWDTAEIEVALGGNTAYDNLDAASFVPPVYTKTWFHNGAYIAEDMITRQFVHEYYKEDPLATLLPDTILPRGMSDKEQGEAFRALKGSLLRQEVYADDGTDKSRHPYSVSEQNYTIVRMQPKRSNRHAVFFTHARESIDYRYERVYEPAHDPRISHQIVLEVDDFGNVCKSVAIGYGRRHSFLAHERDREKQTQNLVTYTDNRFTNPVLEHNAYRIPLSCEARTYELTGHGYSESRRPSLEEALKDVTKATYLEYQEQPDGSLQKRLIEYTRTLFRKGDLSTPLPLGELESMALPYESYKQAFTPGLLVQVYGDHVTDDMLAEGGYVHSEHDDDWWLPSGRVFYAPDPHASSAQELAFARAHFFLSRRFEDPFGNTTVADYDRYNLLATLSRDALGNEVRAEYDYRVLQPKLVIDPNHNHSEAAFDTLGMVAGTAILGKVQDGQSESGDSLQGFVADLSDDQLHTFLRVPKEVAPQLLGNATTRIIFDLDRFRNDGQPVFASTLARENHVNALGGSTSPVQVSFTYSDGFGREAQTKIQAEPGDAPLRETNTANPEIPGTLILEDGKPVLAYANPRWVGKGRTVYNNKGKPIKQYEPFFSATHLYETEPEMVMTGVTPILFYDPVDRVIGTLRPNHTYEKVVFDSWQQATWDVNDTILQVNPQDDVDVGDYFRRLPEANYLPSWYTQRKDGAMGRQERAAANKAAIHANTPTLAYFDTLGRTFLTVVHNRFERDESLIEETLSTHVNLNVEGNQRNIIDTCKRIVMRYDYDMLSNRIHQASMEAGKRWLLNDVTGKPIRAWDSHRFMRRMTYDALCRLTGLYVTESGVERLVERTVYGESQDDAANHRTRVYQVFDGAGIVTAVTYDFKGNLREGRRELLSPPAYKQSVNWLSNPVANDGSFTSHTTYDALDRPRTASSPDGSVYRPTFNEANLLDKVNVSLRGAATTSVLTNVDYDAKGQRERIAYGNGAQTTYHYDPLTFRLMNLRTTRPANPDATTSHLFQNATVVQDLYYTYDPVGNITSIEDTALKTVFHGGQQVDPAGRYTYDALYRLIEAQGREHIGQNSFDFNPPDGNHRDYPFAGPGVHSNDLQALRNYTERYEYDAVGNFEILRHLANGGSWTRRYDFEEDSLIETGKQSNRLTRSTLGNGVNHIETYTYTDTLGNDVNGCMTGINSMKMVWDFKDQLQQVDLGSDTAHYIYDAAGQRVRKVIESQNGTRRKERIYLGSFEIYREYNANGVAVTLERESLHVMDDKQRIALAETQTIENGNPINAPVPLQRYQLSNHLGSASLEMAEDGALVSYEEYHPYGTTAFQAGRSAAEVSLKRYRYTGKDRDEESGLYYYGARYYAPWLGRWTSCDPSGLRDGVNIYVYVNDDPVNNVDLTGNWKISWKEVAIGAGVAILVVGAVALTAGLAAPAIAGGLTAVGVSAETITALGTTAVAVGATAGVVGTANTVQELTTGTNLVTGAPLTDQEGSRRLGALPVQVIATALGVRGLAGGGGGSAPPGLQLATQEGFNFGFAPATEAAAPVVVSPSSAIGVGASAPALAMSTMSGGGAGGGEGGSGRNGEEGQSTTPSENEAASKGSSSQELINSASRREFYDLDEAATSALGENASITAEYGPIGPVKNPDVRADLENLGYNPDDFKAVQYQATSESGTSLIITVFEAAGGIYFGPHVSSANY